MNIANYCLMSIHDEIEPLTRKEVFTVNQNESLGFLIREMNKLRFRRFPVKDDNGHFKGIVTVSDVIYAMYQSGNEDFLSMKVEEIMTTDMIVAKGDDSIMDTILTMYNAGISGVPVIKDSEVIGMFTEKDILLLEHIWREVKDSTVTHDTGIGRPIDDITVISDEFTFWQTADRLVNSSTNQLLVKYEDQNVIRGLLGEMELAYAVVDNIIIGDSSLSYLQTTKVSGISIRPLYQRSSPTVVSSLRMWMNSRAIEAFPLFHSNKPVKLITEKDLVGYLAMHLEGL